jgi:predicted nucleotidyltransferase
VLAVLFGNVDRSFYANEIIRLAGTGTGAVQRELESLTGAGLVTVTRVGNQKHFQANARAAVYNALHDLVLKTSGVADVLRAALADIALDVRAAFVYGSVAKNEDRSTSDIDLMVISDRLAYAEVFAALEPATRRLGRTVNPTLYTQAEFARRTKAKNAFVSRLLSQPMVWIIGGADDLAA